MSSTLNRFRAVLILSDEKVVFAIECFWLEIGKLDEMDRQVALESTCRTSCAVDAFFAVRIRYIKNQRKS